MSAVDRIMRAYVKKHPLTPTQAVFVRRELSRIIDDLLARPRRAPMMLPEVTDDVALRRRRAPDIADEVERHARLATDRV